MSKSEIDKALFGRRKSKYNVGPPESRIADGIVFDSIREKDAYCYLKALERAGTIRALELQVAFPLRGIDAQSGTPTKICYYVADFTCQSIDGKTCIYDAKGMKTAMYRLKKKWFELQYGLRIIEL